MNLPFYKSSETDVRFAGYACSTNATQLKRYAELFGVQEPHEGDPKRGFPEGSALKTR